MRPEDIDDLFRNSLDDHTSPPPSADALWVRLQQAVNEPAAAPRPPADERLDALFQGKLSAHVTPPSRELWERLEDEHLRPRKRRVAAWWPMAIAAVVALLLVAGGAGLLMNGSLQPSGSGQLAASTQPGTTSGKGDMALNGPEENSAAPPAEAIKNPDFSKIEASQATALAPSSSSAPEASESSSAAAAKPRPAQPNRRAAHSTSSAMLAQQSSPSNEPAAPVITAPHREMPGQETTPQVAVAPTSSTNTPDLASPAGVIEVEVRKSNPTPDMSGSLAAGDGGTGEPGEAQPRRGLGKLIGRASVAVRDAKQGLLARAAQYENVTVHARLGERTISKTIQL